MYKGFNVDIDTIETWIKMFKESGLTELSIKKGDFEVVLKGDRSSEKESKKAPPMKEINDIDLTHIVQSSMVGTFYRGVSADAPPFVQVGDRVKKGDPLCIIEAMKVMNVMNAEREGLIVKIEAKDGDPIEFGAQLFVME